jgi:hypothetical protein
MTGGSCHTDYAARAWPHDRGVPLLLKAAVSPRMLADSPTVQRKRREQQELKEAADRIDEITEQRDRNMNQRREYPSFK